MVVFVEMECMFKFLLEDYILEKLCDEMVDVVILGIVFVLKSKKCWKVKIFEVCNVYVFDLGECLFYFIF